MVSSLIYYQEEKDNQEKQSNHNKRQRQSHTYSDEEREEARKDQQQKQKEQEKKEEKSKHTQWDSSDYYIVLGLERTATFEEIKKKYKQLSRIYHPDFTLTKKEEHGEISKKINNAYKKLKKLHESK